MKDFFKKKAIIYTIIIALVLGTGSLLVLPHQLAVSNFNKTFSLVKTENTYLSTKIQALQALIDSGEEPLSESDILAAKQVVETVSTTMTPVPELPQKTKDIKAITPDTAPTVDYSELYAVLDLQTENLKNSFANAKLLTNPTEEYVISALNYVDEIIKCEAATENNDPNEKLHKAGGYTSAVFFASSNTPASEKTGNPVNDGTDGGGCIEVYTNKEDANKRNYYLSAFDGTIFDSGSHSVYGTIIIRTSTKLTASKQKELENKILDSLCKK